MSAENVFDREAEPGRYFYCDNGQAFRSIRELQKELANCSEERRKHLFELYVPSYKNDFANWIIGVFNEKELATRLYPIKDPKEFSKALTDYETELKKKNEPVQAKVEAKIEEKPKEEKKENDFENTEKLKIQISERVDRADLQFDKVKKIKQHSFFNKAELEDTVEGLKNRYDEINHSITEHRKDGKDMSIPSMMLRNVLPKINYFQISQNKVDYDKIMELMDDIEKEVNYSKESKVKDLKNEIMEVLGIFKNKKED